MRTAAFVICALLLAAGTGACAVTLTFDDVPTNKYGISEYYVMCGVCFDPGYVAAEHTLSTWGPPHSGSNVLVWTPSSRGHINFVAPDYTSKYATLVGGYFSTELGTVLEMRGYRGYPFITPVVTATIGAAGESWNSVYVEVQHLEGVEVIELKAVTTNALRHFCMDDMTINFVPEPSSLSILSLALASVGAWRLRRRR